LKSKTSAFCSGFCLFSIFIASSKLSTSITSIQGIIEASFPFAFGTNILLNHFSFAHIVLGNTLETFLSFQSRDNSQIKIESFT
jgi:hypothetical protein